MPASRATPDPLELSTFGELLRYVRRRARLTQRDLGIAVGYSESHINRFEKNRHVPDPATVAALFVPALDLGRDSGLAARLIELASTSVPKTVEGVAAGESIPLPAPHEVTRPELLGRLRARLRDERCVALCGLPGVGKTTLASALAREQARHHPVFWLTLTAGITASADAILHALAVFLVGLGNDSLRSVTTRAIGAQDDLPLERRAVMIARAIARRPLLICIDNAELIRQDEACLQVLRHLMTTTAAHFLLTSRESLPATTLVEIPIVGLEPAEGLQLIRQSTGQALSAPQAQRLLEKTAGSPMLLRLALGKLAEPALDVETTLAHLETQSTIAAYLLHTLREQLTPPSWRLLCLLSVFTQAIDLHDPRFGAIAFDLGEAQSFGDAVRELQRRQLIDDAATALLHPLVRDFVYRALSEEPTRAQRLHRLAGDWCLLEPKDPHEAARHYGLAGLLEAATDAIDEHLSLLITQGKAARAVEVLDLIQSQLQRARGDSVDLRRRVLTLRGVLLMGTLRAEEAEADLREALSLTPNPAVRAGISVELAESLNQRSRYTEMAQVLNTAMQDLASGDVLLRAQLRSLAALAYSALSQMETAQEAAEQALALTEPLPLRVTGLIRARAHGALAGLARARLDRPTAMRQAKAAVAAARAGGAARAACLNQAYVGGLYYDLGDLDESFAQRQEALEGLLAIGDVHSAAYVLTHLADIHHARLEQAEAIEKLTRAGDILRTVNDLRGLAGAESARAGALLWLGELAQARQVIEHLLVETESKVTERNWGYRLNKRAMILLVQGATDDARLTLERALELPAVQANAMQSFELHTTLAVTHLVSGKAADASEVLALAPRREGLSRWAEFDRELVAGYARLAANDPGSAQAIVNRLEAQVAPFAMYRRCADRLQDTIRRPALSGQIPWRLWVGAAPATAE